VQSERRLRFFLAGLMCGGIALVIQVHQHLSESASKHIANFQQLKSAATFDTWNPNTIGQATILLVFGAGLGGILFSKSFANRILWPCLAMGFALVPAALFARGTTLSIVAGFVLFLCVSRKWKWVLIFAAVCLGAVLYLHSRDPQLVEDASNVDVTTGEGFSHRFERWDLTFHAIQENPILGKGFGQELASLTLLGSEGRAHNEYLAVWLELGLGGLLLFLFVIFQFVRAGYVLYRMQRFQRQGALILSLIVTLCLDSLGLPILYWEKFPTIALSLSIAAIGLCERCASEVSEQEVRFPSSRAVEQLPEFPILSPDKLNL
jgi:O-antigen ligase